MYIVKQILKQRKFGGKLKRIIMVKKSPTTLELTNEFLLIADESGDVYKVDLSFNDNDKQLILSDEYRIMEYSSMLLDMAFIRINDKKSFILTADRDNEIRLSQYPNISHDQSYCLGHTEFVLHLKLIDNHHVLSASGDGKSLFVLRAPPSSSFLIISSSQRE